ncbi:MAG TPA: T9SS type A sorting domain-containing protein [Bacteroidia bacterium]
MKKTYSLFIALILLSSAVFASGHTVTPTVVKHVTCLGGNDGQAYVTVSGGTGPFTYTWNSAPVQTNDTLFNATAGSYTCTVTDQNDMSTTTAVVTINPGISLNVMVSGQNIYCNGMCNGSIATSVVGGTQPYNYTWSPAVSTTSVATNLCAGAYTITATDANGCVGVNGIAISGPSPITISTSVTHVSCAGGTDGSIYATVSGGTAPYTYTWNGGSMSTMPNLTNAPAGTYTLVVTDANGCTASVSVTIMQPTQMAVLVTTTNPTTCNSCDGSASAVVSGGTPGYVYMWNNGSTVANMFGLCPGTYTCTVVDANGCASTGFGVINTGGTLNVTTSSVPDTCGQSVGSATATTTGAQGPVTFMWQPGNYTTQSIANVPAGNYQVTVSDTVCSFTSSVTIANYSAPNIIATSNPANCGNANGLLTVNASNATAPYQFSINGSALSGNTTYNNLAAGSYTILCQDANGCQSTITHIVQATGLYISITSVNATCNSNNGGSYVGATSGTPPYTYLWSNGSTNQTQNNLAAGTYTCVVTDNAGCVATGVTTIGTQATIYLNYDYDYYNCGINSLDATANFGAPPYNYSWSPGGQTTPIITNQPSGIYTCTVTDANGCTGVGQYWIGNNNYSIVTGAVYADLNGNCILDMGEDNVNPISITATNSLGQNVGWGYVWNQSNTYTMYLPQVAGTYTLNLHNSYYYNYTNMTFNCSNNVITLNGNCDTLQNINLGYTPVSGQDLHVTSYCGTPRPGFTKYNSINWHNPGSTPVAATVKMHLDDLLTYTGATPPPTNISGNTLEWDLGTVAHGQYGYISISSVVPTIQNGGALGTVLHDSVWIEPIVGDNYVSDNTSACSSIIVGSYDPNMKEVYADNLDATGGIDTTDTDLYYTVHFQNTGTDTAFTIVVNDTISDLLNINTLEVLSASHHYSVSIQPNRVLQVRFDNILLVDSNRNETLSHGYFHYRIRTNNNLSFGQQIENTADIYFDFNEPVITNTVVTPIQQFVGIKNNTKTQLNAVVYPNPANGGSFKIQLNDASYKQLHFTLYNVSGAKVADRMLQSQPVNEVSTAGLTNGIYFYQLINADGKKVSGKIVINN